MFIIMNNELGKIESRTRQGIEKLGRSWKRKWKGRGKRGKNKGKKKERIKIVKERIRIVKEG